jgi:hypothetical protein
MLHQLLWNPIVVIYLILLEGVDDTVLSRTILLTSRQ